MLKCMECWRVRVLLPCCWSLPVDRHTHYDPSLCTMWHIDGIKAAFRQSNSGYNKVPVYRQLKRHLSFGTRALLTKRYKLPSITTDGVQCGHITSLKHTFTRVCKIYGRHVILMYMRCVLWLGRLGDVFTRPYLKHRSDNYYPVWTANYPDD